jgi:hypothetical protein
VRLAFIQKLTAQVEGIEAGSRPELVGGGLVRSLGGCSQVLSLRRTGRRAFSDERILRSSESDELIEKYVLT